MKRELSRQLIHISGILFIILARFVGKWLTAFYFFIIALTLFLFSYQIEREEKRLARLLRYIATGLERDHVRRPFVGAIWFYFGCGLTFLIFPLNIASAAAVTLAVGDGLATLVGIKFGKHKIVEGKTTEGSLACFVGSLTSLMFVSPIPAFFGSVTATLSELLPNLNALKRFKESGWVDDNLLIPLLSGVVIHIISLIV